MHWRASAESPHSFVNLNCESYWAMVLWLTLEFAACSLNSPDDETPFLIPTSFLNHYHRNPAVAILADFCFFFCPTSQCSCHFSHRYRCRIQEGIGCGKSQGRSKLQQLQQLQLQSNLGRVELWKSKLRESSRADRWPMNADVLANTS